MRTGRARLALFTAERKDARSADAGITGVQTFRQQTPAATKSRSAMLRPSGVVTWIFANQMRRSRCRASPRPTSPGDYKEDTRICA